MSKRLAKFILPLLFLPMLAGCWTLSSKSQTTINDILIKPDCVWMKAGNTNNSLAQAYINNTICGKKYETVLDNYNKDTAK